MYIKPKKSLGQNFLIDKNIQKKIIRACDLSAQDIVLAIGSGRGDLTAQLAQNCKQVYALEIDERFYPLLKEVLGVYRNCQIIKCDILKFDLSKFLLEHKLKQKIKVIGNIPYYISSPIIEHLILFRQEISTAWLTVQKEFGRRSQAKPGSKEYGSFSCFVQYFCQCQILFEISRNSFRPVPNVDSSFLALKFREFPAVAVQNEERFFKIIRAAFNQRRKTLKNSLEGMVTQAALGDFFQTTMINKNVRPEELSLKQFANLSNHLDPVFKSDVNRNSGNAKKE